MTTPLYTLEAAGKSYPLRERAVAALHPLDLRVAKGEFVVVAGPSGSGKSTLLMLLGGLLRPSAGRLLFEELDLYALDARRRAALRARRIGFVFQTFHLIPYLSALDNILVPVLAQAAGDARRLRPRALQLLDEFGLADRAAHRPPQLSVGQRQRVAMARALLPAPDVLLADEPTGNLDTAAADQLLSQLRAFHAGGGTVVLVTHNAGLARFGTRTFELQGAAPAPKLRELERER